MAHESPRVPTTPAPIRLRWTFEVKADQRSVWREVSDTDRFNRVAGMEFEYLGDAGSAEDSRRIGRVRKFGLVLRWVEHAFDFEAPHRYRVDRRFLNGPLLRYVVNLSLTPEDGHTRLDYQIDAWPRSILTRPLMEIEFRGVVRRQLNRMWKRMVAHINQGGGALEPPVRPLDGVRRQLLEDRLSDVSPPEVAQALQRHIVGAPLAEQVRMRPLALAREWAMEEDTLLAGFLSAVRAGVLAMGWDLLCPSCLGPQAQLTDLKAEGARVHCDSCNIPYDASIADALEISFRPAQDLRSESLEVRCIGSPARTPHVVARGVVEPEESLTWRVPLTPGNYRIRALSSMASATLVVEEGAPPVGIAVDLSPDAVQPMLLRAPPGEVDLVVRSCASECDWFVLERRWRPPDTLTAGGLLERADVRDLLPEDILGGGLELNVRRQGVLVTEALSGQDATLERVRSHLASLEPRCSYLTDRTLISTWADPGVLVEAASRLEGGLRLCNAVHVGPVVECGLEGSLVPSGSAVDEGRTSLLSGLPGRTVLSADTATNTEIGDALTSVTGSTDLVPGPTLDGRDHFLLPLQDSPSIPDQLVQSLVSPDEENLKGRLIRGRYRLGEVVGQGGGGTVYCADDSRTGHEVVVKFLRSKHALNPWHLQRFYAEARISLALDHPHVVKVMDFGHSAGGLFYLAMERLEGHELTDELRKHGALPPARIAEIGISLLSGLEAASSHGLVHRDIKPANVFLARDGEGQEVVKLIDFGVAVDQAQAPDPDESGLLIGTVRFMAPELFKGLPANHLSDLYAVGLVLYTCLTAKAPFRQLSVKELVSTRLRIPEPNPRLDCTQPYPEHLGAIIERSLQRDPAKRYPNARAMRLALQEHVALNEETAVGGEGGIGVPVPVDPCDEETIIQEAETDLGDPERTRDVRRS